jgi:hypothetical protein
MLPVVVCPGPDSYDQLATPVPAVMSIQVNTPHASLEGSIAYVVGALVRTVRLPAVAALTILNENPFARVVTTGNTTVCDDDPVKYCMYALVAVSVVVPPDVTVVANQDVYCDHW